MNRAGLLEVFGHSQNTGYLTGGPEYAWPALVAAELGASGTVDLDPIEWTVNR